ncbi:hypothetical protein NBO_633g0002 [Nosema bombycis CQ1]|uniref:Uncharacterized protein n=1 Tax=Nosema bombycis (strain CQ1 / CVCC 102059) TaxID=578461 RepID=R0KP29_NOSB1|nr:hypothetical protein NBO_633g0002 [Nosema bombycis CQ1]|eukprot:EOB11922.1 hypothetical protein NBO_633g0002 [Nosema bombycis CQ1]
MIKTPKGIYLKALIKHLIEQPDIIKANKDHSINMLSSFQDENLPEFLNSSYTPSICSLNMSSSKKIE